MCVCAFMLCVLNFENMDIKRMCKCLGPLQVRHSKYPLLTLSVCSVCAAVKTWLPFLIVAGTFTAVLLATQL